MATCTGLLNTGMITCFQNRKERTLILFFGCSRQQCNNTWIFPQAWQHYLDTKLPLITLHEISINQITWDYHQSSYKKLPLISWFAIVLCSGIPLLKKKTISLTTFFLYVRICQIQQWKCKENNTKFYIAGWQTITFVLF